MHTGKPLAPESCASEVEFATEKLKGIIRQAFMKFRYSWLIQDGEHYVLRSTNSEILFGKEERPQYWKESISVPVYKIWWWNWLQQLWKRIIINFVHNGIQHYAFSVGEIIGDHQCGLRSGKSTTGYSAVLS
jgi:hypothetical protein